MEVGIETIRRIMRKATTRQVSTKAAYFMGQKVEEIIVEVTKKAELLLAERNQERASKHLPEKSKITDELINEVLKGSL